MGDMPDLQQLKARLAKLGVYIDADPEHDREQQQHRRRLTAQHGSQAWGQAGGDASWEAHCDRNSKEVEQLLDRCSRVQQALHRAGSGDGEPASPGSPPAAAAAGPAVAARQPAGLRSGRVSAAGAAAPLASRRVSAPGAAARAANAASTARATLRGLASRPAPPREGDRDRAASRSPSPPRGGAAGPQGSAGPACGSSSLLVRAAQRLLSDAQAEARHVDRALALPAAQARQSAELRSSPLGTVLSQYKEAQAAWAQEKAKLRREAVAARKQASKLELELSRVTRANQHRAADVASLKAALKARDELLEEAQAKVHELEGALAKSHESAAEKVLAISRERDDLQALLLATLQRLEGVESVVAAADATSAAMEDKVRCLQEDRMHALEAAAAARTEVEQLQEAQRRLQWQSQLLEKMSEVQLRHNQRKSAAIKELLSGTAEAAAEQQQQQQQQHAHHRHGGRHERQRAEGGGDGGHPGSRHHHHHHHHARAPGAPSAVLQDVLSELLRVAGEGGDEDGGEEGARAAAPAWPPSSSAPSVAASCDESTSLLDLLAAARGCGSPVRVQH